MESDSPNDRIPPEWSKERESWQNPRIRGLLRCKRILESVFESNYAILHCSPRRLFEIWEQVRTVVAVLKTEVAPFLGGTSEVASVEQARQAAAAGLAALKNTLLADLEKVPTKVSEQDIPQLRRTLCTALLELGGFVRDNLSRIVASDPRCRFDVDYFLSKRFSRDVNETEWLYSSVCSLQEYLRTLDVRRKSTLQATAAWLELMLTLPEEDANALTNKFLDEVMTTLAPMLRTVVAIPGIRLSELELLDRITVDLPMVVQSYIEVAKLGHGCKARLGLAGDEIACTGTSNISSCPAFCAVSGRMADLLRQVDDQLRDLLGFVVVWERGLAQRRALLLNRPSESGAS